MRTKNLLKIIIPLVIIICIIAASLTLFTATNYKNITMNGITLEVKDSNTTVTNQTENYYIYNDTQNNIMILEFDSTNASLNDLSDAATFAAIRDVNQAGAQQQNNASYNYSQSLKQYTYLTNYTHKNLFIVTKNKEDMEHILSSIKVDESTLSNENNTNNTTTDTKKSTTKKSTTKKTSEREEDKITPDGWDPKKHEVSRENIGGGDQRVYYDDGYSRVVNKKGDILSYGF